MRECSLVRSSTIAVSKRKENEVLMASKRKLITADARAAAAHERRMDCTTLFVGNTTKQTTEQRLTPREVGIAE